MKRKMFFAKITVAGLLAIPVMVKETKADTIRMEFSGRITQGGGPAYQGGFIFPGISVGDTFTGQFTLDNFGEQSKQWTLQSVGWTISILGNTSYDLEMSSPWLTLLSNNQFQLYSIGVNIKVDGISRCCSPGGMALGFDFPGTISNLPNNWSWYAPVDNNFVVGSITEIRQLPAPSTLILMGFGLIILVLGRRNGR